MKKRTLLSSVVIFLLIIFNLSYSQDSNEIIKKVREKQKSLNDYKADIKIKVNIDFLKVPDVDAKIFYKKPDKFKIQSDGFLMLPKEGFNFSPESFFKENITSVFVKKEVLNTYQTNVIKIIPNDDKSDLVLSTIWIDEKENVIRKVESTFKQGGTVVLNFDYEDKLLKYGLPSKLKFTFDLKNMRMPKNFSGFDTPGKKKSDKPPSTTGEVIITYSNYSINKGVDDKIFQEK
ncbi:MAG: hypothetical protein N2319_00180 [Candidatus Kapabacteria bacterium]|nr:hypothetical protein [Candidatus Kapabacteria bacterium]